MTHSSLFSGSTLYSNASFSVSTGTGGLSGISGFSGGSEAWEKLDRKQRRQLQLKRRRLRSKEAVRLAVLKVNRRLLSLLNQDDYPTDEGDDHTEALALEFTSHIMDQGSNNMNGASAGAPDSDTNTGPRILPGFLRRSLRGTFDEGQPETEQAKSVPSTPFTSSFTATSTYHSEIINSNNNTSLKNRNIDKNFDDDEFNKNTPKKKNNHSTLASDQTDGSANNSIQNKNKNGDSSKPIEKKKSYKLTAFENCINAPIVDLRDLRRLGWNGIPVSQNYPYHSITKLLLNFSCGCNLLEPVSFIYLYHLCVQKI